MIVAGFGFRASATLQSLEDALSQLGAPSVLATPEDKAAHPAFLALATKMRLPVVKVTPDNLREEKTATHSNNSHKYRRTGSVAEASALAAAGPGARLLTPRVVSTDRLATCALAQSAPKGAPS